MAQFVMKFDDFAKMVDNIRRPEKIGLWIANHVQAATEQLPISEDAKRILEFNQFISEGILPPDLTAPEKDFYRRTAERMVETGVLPADVLEQFE
ncbi:hypothetical protein SBV1_1230006 [Verrucomicrobia bacterium]|nr:hypothetical protein SBV1_1230006 [Verrucomicrobiota bacterium]